MSGYKRITKKEFYAEGGFSNSKLVRTQRGNGWGYYKAVN
jgi:hypothetical protein